MENVVLSSLLKLDTKAKKILKSYENLDKKDTRRIHFEMLSSQIKINYINYKINILFSESNKDEFLDIFNNDITQIQNYSFNMSQFISDNLTSALLFQSELVFRYYYSILKNTTPGSETNLNKIIAFLYDDIENNWKKEECNLIVLLWTLRNTIHTGGIYYHKIEGRKVPYKGKTYNFEYGKQPKFLLDGGIIELISDFFDSLKALFDSKLIHDLGKVEHPSFLALDK